MKKSTNSIVIISGPGMNNYGSSRRPPDKGKVWKWVKGIIVSAVVSLAETTVHTTFASWVYGLFVGTVSVGLASWLSLFIPIVCVSLLTAIICGF
ncbi:hypothetical protein YM80_004370 [Salmonella enterica subsp. salamae]|nr:hypothetical protein [Salmonella enterica subsp. salamae]